MKSIRVREKSKVPLKHLNIDYKLFRDLKEVISLLDFVYLGTSGEPAYPI